MEDLISVIMPAYNSEKYIAASIESVLAQTYLNWELLIVNDGSADKTEKIVKVYADKDFRIKYFYQQNAGQGAARNLALANARGKYVAFLDSDDLWLPIKLEKQICYISESEADVIFSNGYIIHGDIIKAVGTLDFAIDNCLIFGDDAILRLISGNFIMILSVLVKRKCLDEVGGFNASRLIQNAEDYHLWLKLAANNNKFLYLNDKFFYYRYHPNQSTTNLYRSRLREINALHDFYYHTGRFGNVLKQAVKEKFNKAFVGKLSKEQYEEVLYTYKHYSSIKSFQLLIKVYQKLPIYLFKKYYHHIHQRLFQITFMHFY